MTEAIPRIQLGLAVYNGEKYLAETLDSILAQTYQDFELIISDNASTDRTRKICVSYAAKDRRIRYYRNRINLGFAPNYNRVFRLSTSEYFKWADYDDMLEPEFLAASIEALDSHPESVLCYPKVKIIDSTSAIVDVHDPQPDTSSCWPGERFRQLIMAPSLAIQTLGVIRRRAILKTALYESYPSSDEIFLAELAFMGPFHEIPERLLRIRLHDEQSTRGALTMQRARVSFYDTSLRGKIILPKWRYFGGCLRAIRRAELNRTERLRSYRVMAEWLLVPAHFRAMGKDLYYAARAHLARAVAGVVPGTHRQLVELSEFELQE
jgi:glycosyltransferase involved in cell wall biosynthesis